MGVATFSSFLISLGSASATAPPTASPTASPPSEPSQPPMAEPIIPPTNAPGTAPTPPKSAPMPPPTHAPTLPPATAPPTPPAILPVVDPTLRDFSSVEAASSLTTLAVSITSGIAVATVAATPNILPMPPVSLPSQPPLPPLTLISSSRTSPTLGREVFLASGTSFSVSCGRDLAVFPGDSLAFFACSTVVGVFSLDVSINGTSGLMPGAAPSTASFPAPKRPPNPIPAAAIPNSLPSLPPALRNIPGFFLASGTLIFPLPLSLLPVPVPTSMSTPPPTKSPSPPRIPLPAVAAVDLAASRTALSFS